MVNLHPHAKERLLERGATETEVIATVEKGETFSAKFGRTGFRRNFHFDGAWRNRQYATKQIEAIAVKENNDWIVVTVTTKYF
ncbi:MAG: DUF4258 domain-containing protein [Nitrospirae bacterium]|nr:DUF4258 domain-containing protein [Nitrospirota bacterium]